SAECDVQLPLPRAARASRPPRAQAATLGRCGAEETVAALHGDVCARRPSLDSPREAAARLAAAGALHHPQRAPADGGVGLQLAVPVVCGLNMDDPVWDATVYSKNRERLLKGDVAKAFFDEVLRI